MILEDMQDQLVDNAKLDFVAANKALVGIVVAVESYYLAIGRVRLEDVSEKDIVASIVPLCKLLALGGRDLRPLREQINLLGDIEFHCFLAVGKLVLGTIKGAIADDRDVHKKAPPKVFTFVLEELKELFGGGDGNIKANMIAGGFRYYKPVLLIGLLREIPELVERTDDTVERLRRSHFSSWRVGSWGRALLAKRAVKVREKGQRASGFVVINCKARVKVTDKVNCALYRFTDKLKLRAQFAHQMDDDRLHSKD
jgi:hypothetical protein